MPIRCSSGIHNGGFRLHPWSDHYAAHGTGGNTAPRVAAYAFHLPSVRQGVDIQDAMVFRKPDRGLDRRSIPFDTLQGEISLTHKGGKVLARHGNPFILDAM